MKRIVWAGLTGLALAALVASSASSGAGEDEVEACLRSNLPARGSIQTLTLQSIDRAGGSREMAGKLYWKRAGEKGSKTLLRLSEPPDLRGSSYLLLERGEGESVDVFVYLPELERVRRITPHAMSGSLFGTDLSYEDFRRLQRIAGEGSLERLPDAELDGRPSFVVRIVPDEADASAYERILAHVDRETCVPLRVAFYERGDEPRKVVSADAAKLSKEGELWVPRVIRVLDRKEETETRLVVEKIEIDPELPDHLFTQSRLARGR